MATQKATAAPPYDRVRVLFPDHHGLARGKYLPLRSARRGTRNCITLFALDFDRTMVPAPGAMLLEGNPDIAAVNPLTCRPDLCIDLKGEVPGEARHATLARRAGLAGTAVEGSSHANPQRTALHPAASDPWSHARQDSVSQHE